jgi:hypothetical protein
VAVKREFRDWNLPAFDMTAWRLVVHVMES